jgi:hypothetical protein
VLAFQLIQKAKKLSVLPTCFLPEDYAILVVSDMGSTSKSITSDLTSSDLASSSEKEIMHALQDANGWTHYLV